MLRCKFGLGSAVLCFLALLTAAGTASAGSSALRLQSVAFAADDPIPVTYTCSGDNKSPALSWSGLPAEAKTLALIVRDPDAPMGSYVHWVLYNLPANLTGLPAAVPATPTIPQGGEQGVNGSGRSGYQGPCPPPGPAHHYHFRLYALDRKLNLAAGANADEVERAMNGHVISSTDLVGVFAR
jgi:Raf kinase inhibitor-like YbhB/YbcL family protein